MARGIFTDYDNPQTPKPVPNGSGVSSSANTFKPPPLPIQIQFPIQEQAPNLRPLGQDLGGPANPTFTPSDPGQFNPTNVQPFDPNSYGPAYTDPGVQQALGQEQMGFSQLDNALKAAREKAIISFGDPALADEAGFGLDPQAATFARQNYLSGNATLARLDKSHDLARQAVIAKLASHGLLGSGDLGYLTQQADQQYGNNVYDARQKLLGYLADLYQQSLDRKQSLRDSLLNAYQNLYATALPTS